MGLGSRTMYNDRMSLSDADLQAIQKLFTIQREEFMQLLDERFGKIPSKEEFFKFVEQITTDVDSLKQEDSFQSHRLRDHEDRLQALENK
jgi:hypothetical protein